MEKKEITLLVWHDCNMCLTNSLINYLTWENIDKDIVVIEIKASLLEENLIDIIEKSDLIVSSCNYPDLTNLSKNVKGYLAKKRWEVISGDCTNKSRITTPNLWFFSLENIKFHDRSKLEELKEKVKNLKSRLNS
ncbi:hypothetical protein K0B04_01500 [Patescibacteria group bacterium]|nr:hypothetical protein [Patescibacteria group bacterium]